MMLGGGTDAKIVKHIAIRLARFDWIYFPTNEGAQTNTVAVGAGLVARF
jgi:hypothetical protein